METLSHGDFSFGLLRVSVSPWIEKHYSQSSGYLCKISSDNISSSDFETEKTSNG